MTNAPPDDEQAILGQAAAIHAAHAAGDLDTAHTLQASLVTRYGLVAIANAMHQRDARERLGAEVELLRLLGPTTLYGRVDPA